MLYQTAYGERRLETVGWMARGTDEQTPSWRRLESVRADRQPVSDEDAAALLAFHQAGWLLLDEVHWPDLPRAEFPRLHALLRKEDGGLAIMERRVAVQLREELEPLRPAEVLDEVLGLKEIRRLGFAVNLFEAEISDPGDRPIDEAMKEELGRLNNHNDVVFAEPALVEHIAFRAQGNPHLPAQWQWHKIDLPRVWARRRGRGLTIAVIDHGFRAHHPDLFANIDRDRSAFFDENDDLKQGIGGIRPLPHGTRCAGMAAARWDNGVDGVGAAPEATLMLLAVRTHGAASQILLARAIAYAAVPSVEPGALAGAGADVISCSLGPTESPWTRTRTFELAIDFAVDHGRFGDGANPLGCPVFWATYNRNVRIPGNSVSAYERVITVGATTSTDERGPGGFGEALDILAPGYGVYSADFSPDINTIAPGGASMAAPCAAGVAALLLEENPNLTWQEVRDALTGSTRSLAGVTQLGIAPGRIDATAAFVRAGGVLGPGVS